MHIAFLQSINLSGYRTWIQLDNDVLVAKQKNYGTKIRKCINCLWFRWLAKIPFRRFKLKHWLIVLTNKIKRVTKASQCIVV